MNASTTILPDIIRPYGDTTGDGMVQISFTLPIPHDKRAEGAALQLAAKMGVAPALLVHAKAMARASPSSSSMAASATWWTCARSW